MKIAIPHENGHLHGHFGGSCEFALVQVDPEKKVSLRTEVLPAPEHQPGAFPRWLREQGVTVVIVGGIACADLLPELQFHAHDRFPLSVALLLGLGTAVLLFGWDKVGLKCTSSPPAWSAWARTSALGFLYFRRGWLLERRWLLRLLVLSVLGPQIANQAGWFAAEVGRQPWIVQGLLRTSEGLSAVVKANAVITSIILFSVVYLLLFAVFVYLLNDKIQHGPDDADLVPSGKLALPERSQP
jgi:hypothetical protein